jgi:[acyl-carrier-protein] S-malonyltransferase
MSHWAMIFPGQGSQAVGMLSEMAAKYPVIGNTFEQASQLLGYDLWLLINEGPAEQLNQTAYTQPALFVAEMALWRCWQELSDARPSVVAGHSLGEYSALACAGVLSFEDALALVVARGQAMQEAIPAGVGAMAAIVGLSDEVVQGICDGCAQQQIVSPANYNSIGQVVIAGHADAVARAVAEAKQQGAKLAKILPVSVPSHCVLMQPVVDSLAAVMETKTWHAPVIPVIQNFDAQAHTEVLAIRHGLLQQLVAPVRWVETIQAIHAQGIHVFVECGPGKILSGLCKRIDRQLVALAFNTPDDMSVAINKFEEVGL